jgi:NADP-dependent 3-hydroxy acid dehydrogenase YdfG
MLSVNGRTIFLTGAAGGIGSVVARRLSSQGANLVLVDVRAEPLEALARELGDGVSPSSARWRQRSIGSAEWTS